MAKRSSIEKNKRRIALAAKDLSKRKINNMLIVFLKTLFLTIFILGANLSSEELDSWNQLVRKGDLFLKKSDQKPFSGVLKNYHPSGKLSLIDNFENGMQHGVFKSFYENGNILMSGVFKDILLTRASDDFVYEIGQDGGLVSSILIWCLENDIIDGALISGLEGNIDEGGESGWKAKPMVATNREEVLSGAGSRYTYSANTMAYPEAKERGLSSLALVGMSCQTSIAPVMWHRKVGKVSKPIKLNIGLLCSKSFDDSMFDELFWMKYGLHKDDIKKMNIKGVFQVWMNNGDYHEINLKECHAWTREGCNLCPDFAAEHADISTGGIGEISDWTLTIVRTDLGRAVIDAMVKDGVIETRPGDDDPGAIALMHKLAQKSRSRWPEWANESARIGLPTKKS